MKNKKSSRKKWIFIAIFVLIAAIVSVAGLKGGDDRMEVTIKSVKRGDITSIVTATGKIQPEVEVVISSEVPGEIIELPVKDGDPVEKGELLVRVNPDTLEAQVKQQEASLASTKAGAAQRRAEMLQAQLDLNRIEGLFKKEFSTQDDLEQARTRLEVAKAAHESSLFQIKRQEMQLKEANDQLAKASIYSPITGTVVSLASELGDRVVGTGQFAGTEIMRVANLNNMEVQVDVSEADIVNVAIDDKATIEVDALPKEPLEGIVTEIANSAESTGQRSQEQLTTFAVRIKLTEPAARLRPGMTATADIETDTVEDVVKAPLGSVVVRPKREVEKGQKGDKEDNDDTDESSEEDDGKKDDKDDRVRVVFLAKDGKAILTKVETGIADRDFIELKSGVEEGDRIITGSYRALTRDLKDESEIKEKKIKKKEDK
ncbi:efflux RND transporter periplasmic adaptor subunit [Puniceicoccales bacterium CK1056]|uniref:Efflux RND transporter periplasmic adaptor subunit n=1 Tax=Oceanipulchritudo coccoides TaxID=2706888 RepID=A0A6B2M2Q0_9BACT|nr:efflux RND transporter periplasmic adaptor subunit [Oceanipulchritudo coccoides]NDV61990.1 efflux RND transporter periplasmic adaptor subunit [Oceanipulchritudo coccoides]